MDIFRQPHVQFRYWIDPQKCVAQFVFLQMLPASIDIDLEV
jgi:hypothetical protein